MNNYSRYSGVPAFHEEEATDPISAPQIISRWKIAVFLLIVFAIVLNAILENTLITVFGFASVTFYGVIVIIRKFMQLVFARMNNRRMRYIVRQPIIETLVMEYPQLQERAAIILKRSMHFPDFKQQIIHMLEEVYDLWALEEGDDERYLHDLPPGIIRLQWAEQKWRDIMARSFYGDGLPPRYVGLVVPTYRTSELELQRLIESLEDQTYPFVRVTIVLNENTPEMKKLTQRIIRKYGDARYIRFVEPRRGKRNAMRLGFADFLDDEQHIKYIFNVDSDSRLHPDAIANAVRVFEAFPQVSCMTGDIRVANADTNLLTRLTEQRYFFAFNVERAAQSLWGSVTCLSGPFMAVRTDTLRRILRPWAEQKFLGKPCTYGDDRHLSTLVLKLGQGSAFSPDSISWTDAPSKMSVWRLQQTRWARSAWRETIITAPWLHRLPLWVVFDTGYLAVFPFILWGIVLSLLYRAVIHGPALLVPYIVVVVFLVFLFNSVYGILANRDFRYLLNPLYLIYQFVYLQPLRIWALISLDQTKWGTK